jgi:5-formyltetrahydrofolate cyclo-ligase
MGGSRLFFGLGGPGEPLANGVWNIPVPATTDEVVPDIVIAPVVGFDRACYRLGYGGGFFDRTLATMKNSPRKLGVGYRQQALLTIHPQPHDIPMDMIITEQGAWVPNEHTLEEAGLACPTITTTGGSLPRIAQIAAINLAQ